MARLLGLFGGKGRVWEKLSMNQAVQAVKHTARLHNQATSRRLNYWSAGSGSKGSASAMLEKVQNKS